MVIQDAITAEQFFPVVRTLTSGEENVESALAKAEHVLEGQMYVGGQEHFYLETNACIAVPKGEGEMEIIASTQALDGTQKLVARALGVEANKVVARVKRIGVVFLCLCVCSVWCVCMCVCVHGCSVCVYVCVCVVCGVCVCVCVCGVCVCGVCVSAACIAVGMCVRFQLGGGGKKYHSH